MKYVIFPQKIYLPKFCVSCLLFVFSVFYILQFNTNESSKIVSIKINFNTFLESFEFQCILDDNFYQMKLCESRSGD